jgi:hypothetical protein
VVFHFGTTPSSVNIFDLATNGWSTVPLSESRTSPRVMTAGNKILVAGGWGNSSTSNRVDIYDANSNSWSVATLSLPGVIGGWLIGSKLIFQPGDYNSRSVQNVFDVYDASTNAWSKIQLNYNFAGRGVVANNQLFFGGISLAPVGSQIYSLACKVWKFQF